MDCPMLLWLPQSVFRSPRWRWLRATWLNEHDRPADSRIDDDWVERAGRAQMSHEPKDHREAPRKRAKADWAVQEALNLFRSEEPYLRWKVEALLLTREPLGEVAKHADLSVEVVEAFHQLFFDVRPHLHAGDWIMLRAIGCGPWNNFNGELPGALWKYAAYTGGVRILEAVIALTLDLPFPDWLRESARPDAAYQEARLRLLGKLTLNLMTAQSQEEVDRIVQARARIDRLDRQVTGEKVDPAQKAQVMEGFLRALNPHRGARPGKQTVAPSAPPLTTATANGRVNPPVKKRSTLPEN